MSKWRGALSALFVLWPGSVAWAQPQRAPMPPAIAAPQDTAYPGGVITLEIDATDTTRGISRGRDRIPL